MSVYKGTITNLGKAPYKNIQENSESYFVTLNGKTTLWGIDLKGAIRAAGVDKGDCVAIKLLGKEKVQVPQFRNVDGERKVVSYFDALRNDWSVTLTKKSSFAKSANIEAKGAGQELEGADCDTFLGKVRSAVSSTWKRFTTGEKVTAIVMISLGTPITYIHLTGSYL